MFEFYRLAAWRILDRQKVLSTAEIVGEKKTRILLSREAFAAGLMAGKQRTRAAYAGGLWKS
jgi:hypothetical protein